MHSKPCRIYEFGPLRLNATERLLTCGQKTIGLTPKVFDTLLVLVENNGRVVTKSELLAIVWPDSFVEEGNLNRNVSTLRKALDEKPCDHRYIETVPKTGYRFVAPEDTAAKQPDPKLDVKPAQRSNRRPAKDL